MTVGYCVWSGPAVPACWWGIQPRYLSEELGGDSRPAPWAASAASSVLLHLLLCDHPLFAWGFSSCTPRVTYRLLGQLSEDIRERPAHFWMLTSMVFLPKSVEINCTNRSLRMLKPCALLSLFPCGFRKPFPCDSRPKPGRAPCRLLRLHLILQKRTSLNYFSSSPI